MRTEHTIFDKVLPAIGLMIVVPILIIMGSLVVLMLIAPIMIAGMVVALVGAVLILGNAVTRVTPVTERIVEEIPTYESDDLLPEEESEAVEMVEALVDGPREAVTAEITKVFGPCPLGMMPGNSWRIDADGNLSRPMCRPGATALSTLFETSKGDAMGRSTACECLYANREVTFTVREPREESLDEMVGALAEEYL